MPYVRVAVDRFPSGATDEVLHRVKQGLVPILERQPGFVAYEVVKTGEDTAIFINTWETQEQAENRLTRSFAHKGWSPVPAPDRHLRPLRMVTSAAKLRY